MVNFYLGYKLQERTYRSRSGLPDEQAEEAVGKLNAADTARLVNRASVVENTTDLLEPLRVKRSETEVVKFTSLEMLFSTFTAGLDLRNRQYLYAG